MFGYLKVTAHLTEGGYFTFCVKYTMNRVVKITTLVMKIIVFFIGDTPFSERGDRPSLPSNLLYHIDKVCQL